MDTYEKKYKEALERAKEQLEGAKVFDYKEGQIAHDIRTTTYAIFPELTVSEDEKIRKFLIKWIQDNYYHGTTEIPTKTLIAWLEKQGTSYTKRDVDDAFVEGMVFAKDELEKQGEQKLPIEKLPEEMKTIEESLGFTTQKECDEYNQMVSELIMSDNNKCEQKSVDKEEPKFKVGNWYQCTKDFFGKGVTFDKNTAYYCAKEGCLQNEYGCHIAIVKDLYDNFKLWTIQDAKNGDVLHSTGFHNDCIFIFNGLDNWKFDEPNGNRAVATGYCCLSVSADNMEFGIQGPDCIEVNTVKPATMIQRDLLFQKMKEAGYDWDAEKKELKKIELSDVGHEYYSKLLKNDKSDNIADYAYQCVYCMSHDWAIENPTWDNVQSACRLGAKWQKKHDVSRDWNEEDEQMIGKIRSIVEKYAFSQSAVDVNGDLCEKEYIDADNWLKSIKNRVIPRPEQEWKQENTDNLTDFEE